MPENKRSHPGRRAPITADYVPGLGPPRSADTECPPPAELRGMDLDLRVEPAPTDGSFHTRAIAELEVASGQDQAAMPLSALGERVQLVGGGHEAALGRAGRRPRRRARRCRAGHREGSAAG